MGSTKSAGSERAKGHGLSADERAVWDRLDLTTHLANVDIDVGQPTKRKPLLEFSINVPTILAAAGLMWSVMQWYADARVWQSKVEVMRQSDLELQALRDDAMKQRLAEIGDQLKVIGARLDARDVHGR
jgi:hypothetical protein